MKFLPEALTRSIGEKSLALKADSPALMFGAGIVGVIGGTVLACRATLKVEEVLNEANEKFEQVNKAKTLENYSDRDAQKDQSLIYIKSGVAIIKLYSPAIVVGGLGIAALTRSHNILTKRNAALTTAYAALDRGFREYRARVVDKYGQDQDREFRYGGEAVEVDGKIQTRVSQDPSAIYARVWAQHTTSCWTNDPDYNTVFLRLQQNQMNDRLRSKGHIFLNEVYDALGLSRTAAGSVVGWIWQGDGDNYIDFGVFQDENHEELVDFMIGREKSLVIDFNVDGMIYDKIERAS